MTWEFFHKPVRNAVGIVNVMAIILQSTLGRKDILTVVILSVCMGYLASVYSLVHSGFDFPFNFILYHFMQFYRVYNIFAF